MRITSMYTNPRLSLAAVVVASMFATGCSQQQIDGGSSQVAGSSQQVAGSSQQVAGSSQQVAGSSQQVAGGSQQQQAKPAPVKPAPVRPAPRPAPRPAAPRKNPNEHRHPAVPRCTNSVTHIHPNGARSHHHKYSCRGAARRPVTRRPVVRRPVAYRPAVRRPTVNKWTHRHPSIPRCTDSITHTHKYGARNHSHKYACRGTRKYVARQPKNQVNVHALQRKLKAKGYYRGPINGVVTPDTRAALQRYMQNRK